MSLTNLEKDFLELALKMLRFFADSFLLQEMSSRLVFRLHFTIVYTILKFLGLIFNEFFIVLDLFVEDHILLEFVFVFEKKRVFDYIRKSHSFFAVHYENALKKVL